MNVSITSGLRFVFSNYTIYLVYDYGHVIDQRRGQRSCQSWWELVDP